MKTKLLAIFAVSGLIAAAIAYIAPAMADDSVNQTMQTPLPSDNSAQATPQVIPSTNSQNVASSGTETPDTPTNATGASGSTSPTTNTDDTGGPDTATSDDDY